MSAKIDAEFWRHPKIAKLTFEARGVLATVLSWCDYKMSDGRVSIEAAKLLQLPKRGLATLVATGMFEPAEDGNGWRVHDYLEWNDSRDKIMAAKAAAKERAAKSYAKKCAEKSDSAPHNIEISAEKASSEDTILAKVIPIGPAATRAPANAPDYNSSDITADFSRLRAEAGGGKFRAQHSVYSVLQEALEWAQGECPGDPRSAVVKSIGGYLKDDWHRAQGWPFKAWANDPGRWFAMTNQLAGLAKCGAAAPSSRAEIEAMPTPTWMQK